MNSFLEHGFVNFLAALLLLLFFAHIFGTLLSRFSLPRVFGEILGGLLLGPSVLGFFIPHAHDWLFHAGGTEEKLLSWCYSIGLIGLMLISGLEITPRIEHSERKVIYNLILGAIIAPFFLCFSIPAFYDFSAYMGPTKNILAFKILLACAASITAIPIITRIFIELEILGTRFAKVVLSVAAVEDLALWFVLSFAVSLVKESTFSTGGFVQAFTILGALITGIIINVFISSELNQTKIRLKKFTLNILVPIYFAIVGMRLNIAHHFDLLCFVAFLFGSSLIKASGAFLGARFAGKDPWSSINLAIAINARGTPGIVVATIAHDLGVINEELYIALVLVALVTVVGAGIWLKMVLKNSYQLYT